LSEADPTQCVAYGPGLEGGFSGDVAPFTVEVRNSRGERLNRGGAPIDVEIMDPNGSEIPVNIKDNNDGTFAVNYTPQEPGIFTVDVILRHRRFPVYYDHIKGSSFRVRIEPGTDALQSVAFGPGLEDGNFDTLPTHFTIQAKDRHGKNRNKGGDPFKVQIQGPSGPVDSTLKDNNDGTYKVDYKPKEPGTHKIHVTLKEKPISNSPYTVHIREGADPSHTFIESYTFTIRARNTKGVNKKEGGDPFNVVITGSSGQVRDVKFTDVGDGTYNVAYKLPAPGQYKIEVTLFGTHIKGSPWSQSV